MKRFVVFVIGMLMTHPLCAQFAAEPPIAPVFNADFMQQFALQEDELPGSDIADEPDSGNWYEKLHWWKEAKRVYTVDIHDAMEQLKGIVQEYDEKKKTVLSKIETTINSLPVTAEKALALIAEHLAQLKAKRDQLLQNSTEDNRIQLSEIDEDEKALEDLKTDFEHLAALQANGKEAFEVFAKQVKECENYEERALEYFERIEKVLDDKKAHHYYDTVENSLENIKALIQYLIGPLQIFIDQTSAHIETLVPKIKKSIDEQEKKGYIVRILSDKEKAELAEAEKKRKETQLKIEAAKKEREQWKVMPWWKKIFYYIGSFFSWIWSFFKI